MTLSMKVPTTGVPFLIDNLGKDCGLLQYLRELVQNSLDSFYRSGLTGEIIIDADTKVVEGTRKLRIIDNAGGMDEKELISFINSLSVSGGTQSFAGNFGIGGKIAGITQNPEGMIYISWKNGKGHMVHLWKDPTTGYGLKELNPNNPHSPWLVVVEDKWKPSIIDQHGTVVILLGKSELEDTTKKTRAEVPQGVQSSKWVPYYLNNKYFKTPSNVTIRAFPNQSWDSRVVIGMHPYLSTKSELYGVVEFDDVNIHYWVMQLDPTDPNKWARSNACIETFHVAAIYQNEIYGLKTGPSARSIINQFGIVHALKRMAIYVEPKHPRVLPEISRASLKIDGCDLPWSEWAQRFRDIMPIELRELEEQEASSRTVLSDMDDIKRILSEMVDYFKFTTYKPAKKGNVLASEAKQEELDSGDGGGIEEKGDGIGGREHSGDNNRVGGGYGSGQGGVGSKSKRRNPYLPNSEGSLANRTNGSIDNMIPVVRWTDKPELDLVGFAARYYPEKNELLCNKVFVGFSNLQERLVEECGLTGVDVLECWALIEKNYALVLLEAIIGIKYAKDRICWTSDNEQIALSPEALTAICMQRQAQVNNIKRELKWKKSF